VRLDRVHGCIHDAGAIALKRIPSSANSIASERMTDSNPLLVRFARLAGNTPIGWLTKDVEM